MNLEEIRKRIGFRPCLLGGKEPKDSVLLVWIRDTLLQAWVFRCEEVKQSVLFWFALPLPSEEDLPITLFLDAL